MRTLTITALLATLVAIPLIVRRHTVRVPAEDEQSAADDPQRYDLFDFMI